MHLTLPPRSTPLPSLPFPQAPPERLDSAALNRSFPWLPRLSQSVKTPPGLSSPGPMRPATSHALVKLVCQSRAPAGRPLAALAAAASRLTLVWTVRRIVRPRSSLLWSFISPPDHKPPSAFLLNFLKSQGSPHAQGATSSRVLNETRTHAQEEGRKTPVCLSLSKGPQRTVWAVSQRLDWYSRRSRGPALDLRSQSVLQVSLRELKGYDFKPPPEDRGDSVNV